MWGQTRFCLILSLSVDEILITFTGQKFARVLFELFEREFAIIIKAKLGEIHCCCWSCYSCPGTSRKKKKEIEPCGGRIGFLARSRHTILFCLPTPHFFPLPKKVTPKEHERKDLVILLFSSWVDLPTSRLGVPKASRDKLVFG